MVFSREAFNEIAHRRVIVLDGAMGAVLQSYRDSDGRRLLEADFRGERFRGHPQPLKGCNDLLCLTQPQIVSQIHEAYLRSGADIIETCSFNATAVSLAPYALADFAYEINTSAARLARSAADAFSTPERPRFVAGSMGPTAKSASIAPDLNDPSKRSVSWDELEAAYYDSACGLLDGGSHFFLIETMFDSLNAKAAIFAVKRLGCERALDLPIIVSATVSDNGRLLSGQSVEAFCASALYCNPLALGLNCSFGAQALKPYIAALSACAPCLVSAYPNAGFPNHEGAYEQSPETMADCLEAYLSEGLVNIVGGCCGSTPEHIAAIAERAKKYPPRTVPAAGGRAMLSGLDAFELSGELESSVRSGALASQAYRSEFNRLLKERNYDGAVELLRDAVDGGAALVDVYIDDELQDAEEAVSCFLNLALQYAGIARRPVALDSSRWEVVEAALKCLQGRCVVNFARLESCDPDEMERRLALVDAYGAAAVREGGDADVLAD